MKTKSILMTGFVLIAALSACGPPPVTTPTPPAELDESLVAVWVEARRVEEGGVLSEPEDPLYVGFFPDGTFKAVFESRTFETYHDFWGEWKAKDGTLTLTITGGNELPQQSVYEGRYEVREGELTLEGIALVDDFTGPTTIFSYHGPAPESKTVP